MTAERKWLQSMAMNILTNRDWHMVRSSELNGKGRLVTGRKAMN